jgi:hypothetical protein
VTWRASSGHRDGRRRPLLASHGRQEGAPGFLRIRWRPDAAVRREREGRSVDEEEELRRLEGCRRLRRVQ